VGQAQRQRAPAVHSCRSAAAPLVRAIQGAHAAANVRVLRLGTRDPRSLLEKASPIWPLATFRMRSLLAQGHDATLR